MAAARTVAALFVARRLPKGAPQEERDARNEYLARRAAETGKEWCSPERMGKYERLATPLPFRDMPLSIARIARGAQ